MILYAQNELSIGWLFSRGRHELRQSLR
jgi:hypothetical protein